MRFSPFLLAFVLAGCGAKPTGPENMPGFPPNDAAAMTRGPQNMAADMEKAHQRIQIVNDAMTEAEHKSPEEARRIIADAQRRADALR